MRKILLLFFALIIIPQSSALDSNEWMSNDSVIAGLDGHDSRSTATVFYKDSVWMAITGGGSGDFYGSTWDGTQWVTNASATTAGLPQIQWSTTPTVFNNSGTWNLITGRSEGDFYGFTWNNTTTQWVSNTTLVSGLGDIGWASAPTVYNNSGTWNLISGEDEGVFFGFEWNGSAWLSNSAIVSGLGDIGINSAPIVYNNSNNLTLISGSGSGNFFGFEWNGSAWLSNSSIVSGLGDIGDYSTPTAFYKDSVWNLISGHNWGLFFGFSESNYIPPTPISLSYTSGNFWINYTWSAGTGFETDLYNVSQNGTWTNGSTNTYFNASVGPHGWSNISVYAYNNTRTGNLNSTPISLNTQLSNNPISISNISSTYTNTTGDLISIFPTYTDSDSDIPLFGNFTGGKGTFFTNNGTFLWTPQIGENGTYNFYINVTDNNGSIANKSFTISINSQVPGTPLDINSTSGNFFVNTTWNTSVNTDSFNVSFNNGSWLNGTTDNYINSTLSAHSWSNISVFGYNVTLNTLGDSTSLNTQIPNNYPVVSSLSLSATSITTAQSLTFIANITDADNDYINSTNLSILFNLGASNNYSMSLSSNASDWAWSLWTYSYTSATTGSYTLTDTTITDNQSTVTINTTDYAFTITAPASVSSPSGGSGSTTVTPIVLYNNQTSNQSFDDVILRINTLAPALPSGLSAILAECYSHDLLLSNRCASTIVLSEPANWWPLMIGAFIGAFFTIFANSIIYRSPRKFTELAIDMLLYSIIAIVVIQSAVLSGVNAYFLNYYAQSDLPIYMLISTALTTMVITYIIDRKSHKKSRRIP